MSAAMPGFLPSTDINLEPVLITGGSTSIQALLGKSLDLLLGGATPMLYAVLTWRRDENRRRPEQPDSLLLTFAA